MRTTLNIQDELLAEAGKLAGTGERLLWCEWDWKA